MNNADASGNTVSLNHYLPHFAGAYVLASVAMGLFVLLTGFKLGSGGSFAVVMASAVLPAQLFVRAAGRVPAKGERAQFALFATLASLAISAALYAVIVGWLAGFGQVIPAISELLRSLDLSPLVLLMILLFVACLNWVIVYFFTGMMARQALKQRPPR
jgi:hypothetical protein